MWKTKAHVQRYVLEIDALKEKERDALRKAQGTEVSLHAELSPYMKEWYVILLSSDLVGSWLYMQDKGRVGYHRYSANLRTREATTTQSLDEFLA